MTQPTQQTALATQPEKTERLYQALEKKYSPQQFNLILPATLPNAAALEGKIPEIAIVDLSQHTYKISGSDKLGLSKTALFQLAEAAGISVKTEIVSLSANYVCVKATASMSKDGVETTIKEAHKEYDMEAIKEQKLDEYRAKAEKSKGAPNWQPGQVWSEWDGQWKYKGMADEMAKRDYFQIKEHKLALCETKAMNRAIRALLALKTGYTQQELKKPFVVARLKPDWLNLNREQREGMLLAGQKAVGLLTGAPAPASATLSEMETPHLERPSNINEHGEVLEHQPQMPDEMPAFDEDAIDAEFSPTMEDFPPVEVEQVQQAAPQPTPAPSQAPTQGQQAVQCAECGVALEERVVTFCRNRNMQPLCYQHQPK